MPACSAFSLPQENELRLLPAVPALTEENEFRLGIGLPLFGLLFRLLFGMGSMRRFSLLSTEEKEFMTIRVIPTMSVSMIQWDHQGSISK